MPQLKSILNSKMEDRFKRKGNNKNEKKKKRYRVTTKKKRKKSVSYDPMNCDCGR